MSKVALIGDMHFSIRAGSPIFIENMNEFLQKCFFPYTKQHGIKTVIQTGDLFDNRKKNDNLAIHNAKVNFFDVMASEGMEFHTIVGNHCMHYLDKTYPNSSDLFLSDEYHNVHVYSKPKTINVDGLSIDMICWICESNKSAIMDFISRSSSKVAVAHPELNGFKMNAVHECEHGMEMEVFKNYQLVIAGHFHEKSIKGNINYVGSPTQHSYGDVDSIRGFWVLDTESLKMEFIENPYRLFEKIFYYDGIDYKQIPNCENKYISVVIPDVVDEIKYKKFLEEVWSHTPHDVIANHQKEKRQADVEVDEDELVIDVTDISNLVIDVVPFLTKVTKEIDSTCDEKMLIDKYTTYYNNVLENS